MNYKFLKRHLLSRGAVWKILLLLFAIYGIYGTIIFFSTQYNHSADYRSESSPFDIVVIFAGAEERNQPAFDLILHGKAKNLIISPASSSEIMDLSRQYNEGKPVPYFLETEATSTHDNAAYCSEIIKRENAHRVILITSIYHMNRSYRLLSLAMRGYPSEIACYPAFPFGIDDVNVMKRIPYFQLLYRIEKMNMFFNYCKFMTDGTRIKGSNGLEHYLENVYGSVIKKRLSKYDYTKEFPVSPEMKK